MFSLTVVLSFLPRMMQTNLDVNVLNYHVLCNDSVMNSEDNTKYEFIIICKQQELRSLYYMDTKDRLFLECRFIDIENENNFRSLKMSSNPEIRSVLSIST